MKNILSIVIYLFTLSAYVVLAQECTVDGDCDDDLYCSGIETCEEGSCQVGLHPCTNATCDEDNDECTCTGPGEDCEDGIYCNGPDLCFGGLCVHPIDPCLDPVFACDEMKNRCVCLADAACDDENPCTDDICGEDGFCRYLYNTNSCDDGINCNGIDTCGCGTCNHMGDPCPESLACDEQGDFCGSSEVELLVGIGSGFIGTTDRFVNIQLKNSRSVKAMDLMVCDENDYLIVQVVSV